MVEQRGVWCLSVMVLLLLVVVEVNQATRPLPSTRHLSPARSLISTRPLTPATRPLPSTRHLPSTFPALEGVSWGGRVEGGLFTSWLAEYNRELELLRRRSAVALWASLVTPAPADHHVTTRLQHTQAALAGWQLRKVKEADTLQGLLLQLPVPLKEGEIQTQQEERHMLHLITRGPRYTHRQARILTTLVTEMRYIYSTVTLTHDNVTYRGEAEVNGVMRSSRDPALLLWAWEAWRDALGPPIRPLFTQTSRVSNAAAKRGGYRDMGEAWRAELELGEGVDVRSVVARVCDQLMPLYRLLHAHARHALQRHYGSQLVSSSGPLPAHLLGDLWGQDWSSLLDLIILDNPTHKPNPTHEINPTHESDNPTHEFNPNLPHKINPNLPHKINPTPTHKINPTHKSVNPNPTPIHEAANPTHKINPIHEFNPTQGTRRVQSGYGTTRAVVKEAERFFEGLGFPSLPGRVWTSSVLGRKGRGEAGTSCHPRALDMFTPGDYRLMLCLDGEVEKDNSLPIAYHELGHIHYFHSYSKQPAIFRDGANSALHETIGDTVQLAASTPVYNTEGGVVEIRRLLKVALKKLPLITFAAALETWRWAVLEGTVSEWEYNRAWWELRGSYQGVSPPTPRPNHTHFDPASKFHISDNTPYIRYLVAAVSQFQVHRGLCERTHGRPLPTPLHACPLAHSHAAGTTLRRVMSAGSSASWQWVMRELTGGATAILDVKPLLDYLDPLTNWLQHKALTDNLTLGW
ncbi:hypothetical protein Pmani_028570 [Petrolisthes manimaculis]|uniref:Angiotensin-converting enzyme n=1 Tax=Petrolisthes manimaculis TaxID=1843537 RepID=A0AAE1NZU7_9EUCA|nr:hypothetical protein Pmani_028570 [Petrolisthes manimaculis]